METICVLLPPISQAATLVGYWDFEELSGSTVYDQSSFGNDGQLTGAFRSDGKFGRGLQFDLSGGVTIPNSVSLDSLPGGFTFSAWINYGFGLPQGEFGSIFYKTDRNNVVHQQHFQISEQGVLHSVLNQRLQDGGFQGFSDPLVPLNEWHYVAWTYDEFFHRYYLDGQQIFASAFTDPWVGNNEVLQIGQHRQLPAAANFLGFIDEARVYRGAQTRAEILADMNAGVVPEPSTLLLLSLGILGFSIRRKTS